MQHNVPSAIFSHGTIFCVGHSLGGVSAVGAAYFPHLWFLSHTAPHWTRRSRTQKHVLCTDTPCAFGASSAFWWNVSVEKKFGLLLRCANLHLRCSAPSISHAPPSILRVPYAPTSFVLVPQQMAAVNFGHFYCVKLFVKMDRKVTSIIKFKKYKIVNKRSTNSLCTF
jgi:hypothetical protein